MLIQKFHPALRFGKRLTPISSGNPLFSRQGHWDGGSTLHCVAMALALLGRIGDPVCLPYHGDGPERTVWDHAWPHYLHGLTLSELAGFIAELNLGLRTVEGGGPASRLVRFCESELRAGWPVVLGWQQRHPVQAHAALVTGIEGHQHGRTFEPHALLLIDPAGDDPGLAGFNARLDCHADEVLRYRSVTASRAVTPEGALSIRTVEPPQTGA
ncbi:hypothetical protein DPV79_27125 [Burkholderia reimsis]|uniref:Peptidase C39-like domain-containing protein n=1 Tax=Burkholderia reimsis TaxID=2234132 RepID=A0A365QNF1_9BURK|nr:hypothetical protein [Burkholderia reimsis]RBB35696.1 hypothetical protein DPV79_27125 [Burkholderia reimsis]